MEFDNGRIVADFKPGEKPVPEIEEAGPEEAEATSADAERRTAEAEATADEPAAAEPPNAPAGQVAV